MPQIISIEEARGGSAPVLMEDFGAPGSTTEDVSAGIRSEEDVVVKTPRTSRPSSRRDTPAGFSTLDTPVAKGKMPMVISLDEARGGPKKVTWQEQTKRMGKETAQVVDLVAGIPAFFGKLGTRGAMDLFFTATGEAHPMEKSSQIIEKAMEAPWMQFMSAPIQFMTDLDPTGTTVGAVMGKVESFAADVAESAQQAYGGEGGEFGKRAVDLGMAKGVDIVARGAKAVAKGVKGKKLPKEKVDEIIAEEPLVEEARPAEPVQENLVGQDAVWNARNKAYDLIQRGASLREVLGVVKNNPLVGKELDAFLPAVFRSGRREPAPADQPGGTPAEQAALRTKMEQEEASGLGETVTEVDYTRGAGATAREAWERRTADRSEGSGPIKGPPSMHGKADPTVLALIAGAGLGWAYDGWEDVVPGAVLGFAAARLASGGWKNVAEGAGKVIGVPSTIIRGFSPAIADRWVRFEGTVRRRGHEAISQGDVFIAKASKLPKAVQSALASSLFSGDKARTQTLLTRLGDKELAKDLGQLQATLKSLGAELKSLGLIKGVIEDYFPRMVKDLPGLLNKLGVENKATLTKILSTARQDAFKRGDNLSPLEEASIVRNYMMGVYRKGKPGFTKSRVLEEIPEEFLPYYSSLAESYHTYANAAVASIEKAKFFGKALVVEDGKTNLHQSIANLVAQELNSGKLPPEKVDTVAAIMRARFGPGERGPSDALQTIGDVVTLGLLGNFKATLTQAGDIATSAVVQGYAPTMLALMKQAKRTRPITARELGFADYISEEFAGQAKSTRLVNKTLKAVGFSALDLLAKTTTVNAALIKSQRQLRTPEGQATFTKRWGDGYTPQELQQLIADIKGEKITPLVKDYLFSEVSRTQPVSRAELPQAYLEHPNGRLLYKMKSFMIKQLGLIHEEGIRKMARGEKLEGASFLLRYATTLTIAGVPIAAVKAWLEDKPFDIPAAATDNMLKTFGWSQYALEKVKEGKPVQGAWTLVAPPWKMFEEVTTGDPKAWRYMPGVGFMIESRLMGGKERAEKLQKERETKKSDLYKARKETRELRKEMRGE